jgi:hypothetical protein
MLMMNKLVLLVEQDLAGFGVEVSRGVGEYAIR